MFCKKVDERETLRQLAKKYFFETYDGLQAEEEKIQRYVIEKRYNIKKNVDVYFLMQQIIDVNKYYNDYLGIFEVNKAQPYKISKDELFKSENEQDCIARMHRLNEKGIILDTYKGVLGG